MHGQCSWCVRSPALTQQAARCVRQCKKCNDANATGATGGNRRAPKCSRMQQATGLHCMQHMQELAGTITTMLNTEICCKFGCFCLAHSACAESVTQCATSTRFKVTAGDAFVSPLKQELIPKMPPKGNRKARQGKARMWRKKEHTHTHTQIESRKQEGAAAVESDVRSTLRQSLLRLTLSPFLYVALSLSLELRHCSSSTFTHTHTAAQEKREKAIKKETEKRSILFRASRMSFSTFATCCLRLCFCSAFAVSGACLATCHLFFGQMLLPLLAF